MGFLRKSIVMVTLFGADGWGEFARVEEKTSNIAAQMALSGKTAFGRFIAEWQGNL